MNREKQCAYCGRNIELEGGFQGREQTLCRYGNCITSFNNCRYRVKNYLVHSHAVVREFAGIVKEKIEQKKPIKPFDDHLKLLAKSARQNPQLQVQLVGHKITSIIK